MTGRKGVLAGVVVAAIAVLGGIAWYAYSVVTTPTAQSMSAGAATWITMYQDQVTGISRDGKAYLTATARGGAQWASPAIAYQALDSADQATIAGVLSSLGVAVV
jgi:hypothetical protein